jgi:tRNA(fMet)-specific endonuclease VapC
MKSYLLDTNICIYFLKGEFGIDKKIETVGMENCYISEITVN